MQMIGCIIPLLFGAMILYGVWILSSPPSYKPRRFIDGQQFAYKILRDNYDKSHKNLDYYWWRATTNSDPSWDYEFIDGMKRTLLENGYQPGKSLMDK